MHFYSLFSAAALLCSAQAQLSNLEGVPSTNGKLDVLFNSTSVRRPGQLLSKATTITQPQIGVPAALANSTATFMFVMLDLDVPPQQGGSKRRVLLHALNTGMKATRQRVNGSSVLLASSQNGPAQYLPPSPPATDTVPHRYVQLLFDQPASLNIPASTFANRTARFNFDVNKFMSEHSLSRPIAGTFFTVDGRANSTEGGRGSPTGTGGAPRRTSEPFRGAGNRVEATSGFVLMLVVLAVNTF